LRGNASRRIKNIESELKKLEAQVETLDANMIAAGSDVGKVLELNKKRSPLAEKIDALYAEYEKLLDVAQ
jgi:multidrug resistance efflux pump